MSQTPIRTLVAVENGVSLQAVEEAVSGGPGIHLVGLVQGLEEGWSAAQESPAEVLVVACIGYSERALLLVEGAIRQSPERPVIVLSEGSPNGFVRRVFEVGADDLLMLPESPDAVQFALQKALARKQGTAAGVALAPMICVLGPKGGTGKTLTACNLAVSLADAGHDVVLVDLDLQFGDVALSLGLPPERTMYELAKSGGSLDAGKVDDYVVRHSSGLRVLLAPTRPDHAGLITVDFLRDLYSTLRSASDFVVVDTPPGFTPEVIASIDSSSHVCMVAMLDSLSLKNTKLGLDTLELMGYAGQRIRFVLNRADTRVGISREDVTAIVGRAPDVTVPSDRDIPRAVNEATPIVWAQDGSEAAKAFRNLALLYRGGEADAPADENGRRSLISLRRKK